MSMMVVRGLGTGDPSSTSGGTSAIDFALLPSQLLTGAQKWMTPSEAITTLTGAITPTHAAWGVVAGVALVPLLVLSLIAGGRKRFG